MRGADAPEVWCLRARTNRNSCNDEREVRTNWFWIIPFGAALPCLAWPLFSFCPCTAHIRQKVYPSTGSTPIAAIKWLISWGIEYWGGQEGIRESERVVGRPAAERRSYTGGPMYGCGWLWGRLRKAALRGSWSSWVSGTKSGLSAPQTWMMFHRAPTRSVVLTALQISYLRYLIDCTCFYRVFYVVGKSAKRTYWCCNTNLTTKMISTRREFASESYHPFLPSLDFVMFTRGDAMRSSLSPSSASSRLRKAC